MDLWDDFGLTDKVHKEVSDTRWLQINSKNNSCVACLAYPILTIVLIIINNNNNNNNIKQTGTTDVSVPLYFFNILMALRVSPERPKVKKGRPWERADDDFLMYFFAAFWSFGRDSEITDTSKGFYPGFLWKYLPLASVYQKKSCEKETSSKFCSKRFQSFSSPSNCNGFWLVSLVCFFYGFYPYENASRWNHHQDMLVPLEGRFKGSIPPIRRKDQEAGQSFPWGVPRVWRVDVFTNSIEQ